MALVRAMASEYEHLHGVQLAHWQITEPIPFLEEKYMAHVTDNDLFLSPTTRAAVQSGLADYTPMHFGQVPSFLRSGEFHFDVAMICVTPPDEDGLVSLGCSVDAARQIANKAKLVIAQINSCVPRTWGDTFMHITDFDLIVEHDESLPELNIPEGSYIDDTIGKHIAELVEDGSTLQLGIGKIPDAVLKSLGSKNDLGIHSEMISDGIIDLCESGVINGSKKNLDRGKVTATFLYGTKRLYDYVDDNPQICMYPVDFVNDPVMISKNPRVVAINSCIEVDLNGQVNAESFGLKPYSGTGGQVDFIRGATMCPGGKAILAMPSTAKGGTVSRIVPVFAPGTTVTTTRNDVQYIVTEYGAVNLRGKSLRERAELLISIAHPDFRDELMAEFKKRFPFA